MSHDICSHKFSFAVFKRYTNNTNVRHIDVLCKSTLNLSGAHLPAADFDQVLLPVNNEHIPLLIDVSQISTVDLATLGINGYIFVAGFDIATVAKHGMRGKDLQLTHGVCIV